MCQLDPSLLAKAVRERTVTSAAYQLAHVTREVTGIIWPGNYGCYKASHRATRYEYSTTGTNAVLQTADTNALHFYCKFPQREVVGLSGCYKASHCAARSAGQSLPMPLLSSRQL